MCLASSVSRGDMPTTHSLLYQRKEHRDISVSIHSELSELLLERPCMSRSLLRKEGERGASDSL